MARIAIFIVALAVTNAGTAWLAYGRGVQDTEARMVLAAQEHQKDIDKAERKRQELEIERNRLARDLEDAANEEPASSDRCLPASRVRRLNRR